MDIDLLDGRSSRFARALLHAFPEWEPYLRLASWEGMEPGTLFLEVPPPAHGTAPLTVDTSAGEITVGFADWHDHYGAFREDEDDGTRAALDAVRAIVEERLLSVLALDGGQGRRGWHVAPGEPVETHHGALTRVRSWRGTYDADLTRA